MIFYYSGCGNSRFVARELSASLGDDLTFIPDILDARKAASEATSARKAASEALCEHREVDVEAASLGFVFPVYAWAAPKLVEDFVLGTVWKGKPSYVWFACTCGDEMGKTREIFTRTLAKTGLQLNACYCFQMPETYLCYPGFHLDTEDGARRKIEAARAKLPTVIADIRSRKAVFDVITGSIPLIKSYIIRPGFIKNVTDRKYTVGDSCDGCGICMKMCPLHNISLVDGKPHWSGNCTQCMACYHHCPHNAIQFASYTRGKGQYYFGKIK